jgi:hypothetical protein
MPSIVSRLLSIDGVYAVDEKGEVHFIPVAPPSEKRLLFHLCCQDRAASGESYP